MKVIKVLTSKIAYNKGEEGRYIDKYLISGKKQDRDGVIRSRERVKIYQECLELVKEG